MSRNNCKLSKFRGTMECLLLKETLRMDLSCVQRLDLGCLVGGGARSTRPTSACTLQSPGGFNNPDAWVHPRRSYLGGRGWPAQWGACVTSLPLQFDFLASSVLCRILWLAGRIFLPFTQTHVCSHIPFSYPYRLNSGSRACTRSLKLGSQPVFLGVGPPTHIRLCILMC